MLDSKKILIGILFIAVALHFVIAFSSKLKIAGVFMSKPEAGYAWVDTFDDDSRFFWQNTSVKWQEGLIQSDYKIISAKEEYVWNPLAGYQFVDRSKGLNAVWVAGTLHPKFKAWADRIEGKWVPVPGYRLIYEENTIIDSVWDPNKRFEELKIVSTQEQDQFIPFSGYRFIDIQHSLKVVWTPGIVNTDNPKLIAGIKEGTWEINYKRYRRQEDPLRGVLREITKRAIYSTFW